jgi:hypothetical protein
LTLAAWSRHSKRAVGRRVDRPPAPVAVRSGEMAPGRGPPRTASGPPELSGRRPAGRRCGFRSRTSG